MSITQLLAAYEAHCGLSYLGNPDWCDRTSRIVAFRVAQSSMSFQSSGRRSMILVCQSNVSTPKGKAVWLRP